MRAPRSCAPLARLSTLRSHFHRGHSAAREQARHTKWLAVRARLAARDLLHHRLRAGVVSLAGFARRVAEQLRYRSRVPHLLRRSDAVAARPRQQLGNRAAGVRLFCVLPALPRCGRDVLGLAPALAVPWGVSPFDRHIKRGICDLLHDVSALSYSEPGQSRWRAADRQHAWRHLRARRPRHPEPRRSTRQRLSQRAHHACLRGADVRLPLSAAAGAVAAVSHPADVRGRRLRRISLHDRCGGGSDDWDCYRSDRRPVRDARRTYYQSGEKRIARSESTSETLSGRRGFETRRRKATP